MPKLMRITTAAMALKHLLKGQPAFMRQQGWEVVLVSADGPEKKEVELREGCRYEVVNMRRDIAPLADLQHLWQLVQLMRRERPQIVHTHTPKAGLLGMLAAWYTGVPVRLHTIAGLRYMTATGWQRQLLIAMEKLTYRMATQVYANSRGIYQYVQAARLLPASKLDIIGHGSSNGIDTRLFDRSAISAERLAAARRQLDYREGIFYTLVVGRIVRDKGIEDILAAFEQLYSRHPQVRLVLIGAYEPHLDPIGEAAQRVLQTHPGIIQLPWSPDVAAFMATAQLLLHASYREGLPNVLLEAASLGCPIICSRIPGNTDVVTDESAGGLFDVKSPAQLVLVWEQCIVEVAATAAKAERLQQYVRTHFDRQQLHMALHQAYLAHLAAATQP